MRLALLVALAAAAAGTAAPEAALTVIVGATVLDGGGRPDLRDSVVVIRGATIAAVGDRAHTPVPKGADIVDGRRLFLVPAPDPALAGVALAKGVAALVRGGDARIQAGKPARLVLLDGDPRSAAASAVRIRRAWTAP